MIRHTALSASRSGHRLLLVLALCALVLRGLIPAGYMPASGPDYSAAITFCVQGEPALANWAGHAPESGSDEHTVHPACLFGQAQAQNVLPPSPLPVWAPVFLPVHTWTAAASPVWPAPAHTGPALGARAPPAPLLS